MEYNKTLIKLYGDSVVLLKEFLANNGETDILDLDARATKFLFLNLWNQFPRIRQYHCQINETGKKINEECDKLIPFGLYSNEELLETDSAIGCIYIGDGIIVGYTYDGIYTMYRDDVDIEWLRDYLVLEEKSDQPNTYWVSVGQHGFDKKLLTIRNDIVDVKKNYNDDLDMDKINGFIKSDLSGMVILYGKPGTGKTYLLRHIAYEHKDLTFLFFDTAMLQNINSSSFVDFLCSHKNSVVVLEDCETLLSDRVMNYNQLLKTLLNLSDGILGDGLQLKFICTFNADLKNIDKAVLRKGRLKYCYEFKDLSLEKTKAMCEERGIKEPTSPMALCDIFNYDEDTGGTIERDKIKGFA